MSTNLECDLARFIIEKTDRNLFLTGKAGTGKTTFLRDVDKHTGKKHVILAPTGIAAVNAGGMTIHSFFQFGFGPYVRGVYEPEPNYHIQKQKIELIQSLELIIIDEISMVRADLLDHINDILQRIRKNGRPFGGVQLLMIGDLQQLPPIATGEEAEILGQKYLSYYFFDSIALRNSYYHCIELSNVYRQADRTFIDLLNRARSGEMTSEDIALLNSRFIPHFIPRQGENYIRLVTHNSQADIINSDELARIPDREFVYNATVSSGYPKDSLPTSEHLVLKRNAQVMFVRNDPDKRFVNGTLGVIDSIDGQNIHVRLSESGTIIEVEPVVWESIRYKLDENTKSIEAEVKGTFKQYPLKTAWAITVHKSQGLTFDKAEIDVHRAFSPGQAYVALSRCRSLEGIVLNSPVRKSIFITDGTVGNYLKNAIQDIESLACNIGYEYFDYDRTAPEEVSAKTARKSRAFTVVNQNIFDALKSWRLELAKAYDVPAYFIISDRTIADISNMLPENEDELFSAYGMRKAKIGKYRDAILSIVQGSRTPDNRKCISQTEGKSGTAREKVSPAPKVPTWEISFRMFREGKSIDDIALERGLVRSTIFSHLTRYVASEELEVRQFISDDCIDKVTGYRRAHPDATSLKEIFDHFGGVLPYDDIRMALAYIEKK